MAGSQAARVAGSHQHKFVGAKCDPLSEADVALLESRGGFKFPPQLREFLLCVHHWELPEGPPCPLYNWRGDLKEARSRAHEETEDERAKSVEGSRVFDGLAWDVRVNNLWLKSWGTRPKERDTWQGTLLKAMVAAPKLIPVYRHRYAVSADDGVPSTDAVLSVWQSDVIIYGSNLKSYFRKEFGPTYELGPAPETMTDEEFDEWQAKSAALYAPDPKDEEFAALRVPFWGELLLLNGYKLPDTEDGASHAEVELPSEAQGGKLKEREEATTSVAPVTAAMLRARVEEIVSGQAGPGRILSSELLAGKKAETVDWADLFD